jgi:phosphopantetheine--protein transferase-like protein
MNVDTVSALLSHLEGIPGIGVDVEGVDRFAEPDKRLFTAEELAYCATQADPPESRAGRWCAKEAVFKACAKYLQLTLREIEIRNEASGRPIVLLPSRATEVGLMAEVSIAHAGGAAVAVAIAVMQERPTVGRLEQRLEETQLGGSEEVFL